MSILVVIEKVGRYNAICNMLYFYKKYCIDCQILLTVAFYLFLLHGSCYDVRYSSKRWHQYFYRKQKWCFVNHSIHFHLRPHRLLSCHGNPMTFCLVALWCMNRWSAMNSTKRYFHRILKGQIKSIYFKLTFIL